MRLEKGSGFLCASLRALGPITCVAMLAFTGFAAFAQTPPCGLDPQSGALNAIPCSIGGTVVIQAEPSGSLFGGGESQAGDSKATLLGEPQNPGFSNSWIGSPFILPGPGSASLPGYLSLGSINGTATMVGVTMTATCGVLGSATANLTITTPGAPLVLNCPRISSTAAIPIVTGQVTFPPASALNLTITLNVTAPTAGDKLVLGAYSAQIAVNSVPAPPAGSPVILPNGIVPVYSSVPLIQPGSWISIYGNNLAGSTATWNGDFPTQLAGVTMTVNGLPAYLWYVSPGQINAQIPDQNASGAVNVVIHNGSASTTATAVLAPTGPSLSLFDSKYPAAVILTPDGSGASGNGAYDLLGPSGRFTFKTRPVKAGETLELFGVGFGPTSPTVPAGKLFSGSAPTQFPVSVSIGGVSANVAYSGITSAGLFQINITVPNVPGGDQLLDASVLGVHSQQNIYLPVQ